MPGAAIGQDFSRTKEGLLYGVLNRVLGGSVRRTNSVLDGYGQDAIANNHPVGIRCLNDYYPFKNGKHEKKGRAQCLGFSLRVSRRDQGTGKFIPTEIDKIQNSRYLVFGHFMPMNKSMSDVRLMWWVFVRSSKLVAIRDSGELDQYCTLEGVNPPDEGENYGTGFKYYDTPAMFYDYGKDLFPYSSPNAPIRNYRPVSEYRPPQKLETPGDVIRVWHPKPDGQIDYKEYELLPRA